MKLNNNHNIITFLFLMLIASTVYSQELQTDTIKGGDLKEFVVTSSRSPIAKEKTPQSIDIINSDDIKLTSAVEFTDILKNNSSINVVQYPGLLSGVSIRGFRPQTGSLNQRVLLLVDGRPAGTTSISTINPANIERVEVLKGPASALYGSQAMGGVINLITKKTVGLLRSTITGEYGSFQTFKIAATSGGAITKNLDFDLSLNVFDRNKDFKTGEGNLFRDLLGGDVAYKSYSDGSTKEEVDSRGDGSRRDYTRLTYSTGSLRLGYQLTKHWRVDVKGERFNAKNVESPSDIAHGNSRPNSKDLERNNGELSISGVVKRHSLMFRAYSANETTGILTLADFTGKAIPPYLSFESRAEWLGFQIKDIIQFGQHSVVLGFDYNDASTSSRAYNADKSEGRPYSPNYSLTTSGIYAQGQLSLLNSRLSVNPGLRFDNISYNVKKTPLLETYTGGKETNPFVSPSLGVQYQIIPVLGVHSSVGQAYVTPDAYNVAGYSLSRSVNGASLIKGNPDLTNENSITFDAGARFNHAKSGLSLDLTYFTTKVKDRITTETITPTSIQLTAQGDTIKSITTYINANEADISGLEVEMAYDFGALRGYKYSLKLFANATRTFAAKEITIMKDKTKTYKYIYNVPDFTSNYGLHFDNYRGLNLRLNGRYVGHRKDSDFNDPLFPEIKYPAFLVMDFAASYTYAQKHSVSVLINNITDENYYEKRGFNMPGRNYSLRYSISF